MTPGEPPEKHSSCFLKSNSMAKLRWKLRLSCHSEPLVSELTVVAEVQKSTMKYWALVKGFKSSFIPGDLIFTVSKFWEDATVSSAWFWSYFVKNHSY